MAISFFKLKKIFFFQLASKTDPKATIVGKKTPINKAKPTNGATLIATEKKIITKEPIAETKVNGDVNCHQAETNEEAHSE